MLHITKKKQSKNIKGEWGFYIRNSATIPTLILSYYTERTLDTNAKIRSWDQMDNKKPTFTIPLPNSVKQEAIDLMLNALRFDVAGEIMCLED